MATAPGDTTKKSVAPKMKKCAVCTKESPDSAAFCGSCGVPFSGVSKKTTYAIEVDSTGVPGTVDTAPSVDYCFSITPAKNGEAQSNVTVVVVSEGAIASLTTTSDGHIQHKASVTAKWQSFIFRYQLAEKCLWLPGPIYQRPVGGGFMAEFRGIIKQHGGVNCFAYLVVTALVLVLMSLSGMASPVALALGIMVVSSVIFLVAAALINGSGYLGYIAGQVASNNNYRWLGTIFLLVVFLILLMLKGLGGPVIAQSYDALLNAVSSVVTPIRVGEGSWAWLGAFGVWLLVSLVYTPIAFRDELVEVLRVNYRAVQNKRRTGTATGGSGQDTGKGWTFGKDFLTDMLAESIFEIPRLIMTGFGR